MKALVVYESLYGNTAMVGEAISDGLRSSGIEVQAGRISAFAPSACRDVGLLVVGGPTHTHGMSKAATRETAAKDHRNTYPEPTVNPGLREWLGEIPAGEGRLGVAFDTRIKGPIIFTGSAAKGIAQRLEAAGYELLGRPESFLVTRESVLITGERDRARRWGVQLSERAAAGTSAGRT